MKIWLVLAILVQLGASVLSQQTCGNFADLMVSHRLTTQRFKQQATKYICHHHTKKKTGCAQQIRSDVRLARLCGALHTSGYTVPRRPGHLLY